MRPHTQFNLALLAITSILTVGCITSPGKTAVQKSTSTVSKIDENHRVVLKVNRHMASAKFDTESWNRGRLTVFGSPMTHSNYPVTKVYIDFVGIKDEVSTAVRNPRLIHDGKSLIFYVDSDHRAEWLEILSSNRPVSFWLARNSGNGYSVGFGHTEEVKRELAAVSE